MNTGRKRRKPVTRSAPLKVSSAEGVYYVVCLKGRWRLFYHRHEAGDQDWDHTAFWESSVVWQIARSLRLPPAKAKALALHPYGFPRGRVTKVGRRFRVYHGNDTQGLIDRAEVEEAFGIRGLAQWCEDDHEHCLDFDSASVRRLLSG